MKKRILCVLLTCLLVVSAMAVVAFAATDTIRGSGMLTTSQGEVFKFTLGTDSKVYITYQNTTPHTTFDLMTKKSGKWKTITPKNRMYTYFDGSDYYYGIDDIYELEAGDYTASIYAENTNLHTVSAWKIAVKASFHTCSYTYRTKTYEPTCSKKGYTRYYCECGEYKEDDYVSKLPHTEVSREREEPTCLKTGLTAGVVCSVCDTVISGRETIPKTDHAYRNNQCTVCGRKIGTCGTALEWALESDGKLAITGSGAMTDFPKGGAPWYADREKITSVTLPDGLTNIGAYAFEGLSQVTEIKLPESVTALGAGAFSGCEKVKKLTIPSAMTAIGDETFSGCAALTGITIPKDITAIGAHAFENCTGLKEVKLPEGITTLSDYVFSGCTGLTGFVFPEGVTTIGDHALAGCTGITKLTILENVTAIGKQAFSGCTGITELLFKCNAPAIGAGAFKGLTATIHYRESLPGWENVVNQGFGGSISWNKEHSYTSQVTEYTCKEQGYTTHICGCGEQYVDSYTKPAHRFTGDFCTKCSKAGTCGENLVWEFEESTGTLTISGTGEMKNYTFYNRPTWKKLVEKTKHVVIEEGITSIGKYAFHRSVTEMECLETVSLPSTLTKIQEEAFTNCQKVTKIELPAGLTYLGNFAFSNCGIQECVIPEGITTINKGVFYGCKLEKITFQSAIRTIGEKAFSDTSLKQFEIPKSVYSIEANAFNGAELTEVTIPSSVTSIGADAFARCSYLRNVTIDCTVVGEKMFWGCNNLTEVILTDNVKKIHSYAFSYCEALTAITIPEGVTLIESYAFRDCKSLTSIVIPASVTRVKDAFEGCSSLKTIYFQGKPCLNILYVTFKGVTATAYYPADVDEVSWAESIKRDWGGIIKWVKYSPCAQHSFGEWIRTAEPTCVKAGVESSACGGCETTQTRSVAPLGHTWDAGVVTAPVCLDKGYTTFTCTVCRETKKESYTDPTGHIWDAGTITTEPTEEKTGVKTYTCTACQETKTETVPKLEHTHKYETAVTLPTCTEKGYTTYTCPCGDTKQDDFVDPTDHKWDEGVVTKAPTAEAEGEKTFTCTVCDDKRTEVLPKEVHIHDYAWKQDAVKHWKECTCGDKQEENEHRSSATPDCGTQAVCDVCGMAYGEVQTHKYDDIRSDSVCHWHKCMACDKTWDKENHTDTDGNQICDVCKAALDGTIGGAFGDASWHLQEAWYNKDGWNLYISGSGEMPKQNDETGYPWYAYRDKIIEVYVDGVAIGDYAFREYPNLEWLHAGTDISTESPVTAIGREAFAGCAKLDTVSFYDKIPTIADDAFKGVKAEVSCSEAIDLAVVGDYGGDLAWDAPNITHTFAETVVAPTCEQDGYTLYTCTKCGYDKRGNSTDKVPHSYEGGKCTACGAVDESYVPGDIVYGDANGDGKINAKDAMLVLQYYTKKITEDKLKLKAVDVDGNGRINAKDAMLILQFYTKKIEAFPVQAK